MREALPGTAGNRRDCSTAVVAAQLLAVAMGVGALAAARVEEPKERGPVVITIVYDNYPADERLKTAWGFACVVQGLDETILFDTGGDGKLLLANMAKAGLKPDQIEVVVLSHIHGDHTGGLAAFLGAKAKVKVVMPSAFPSRFKRAVRQAGATVVETDGPCEVCKGAWTTGVLNRGIAEQGLYLKTPDGIVVITGCAHPGVVDLAAAARRHAKQDIYAVFGGFHMGGASARQIDEVIEGLRKLGVERAGPCHCSGDDTRRMTQAAFGDHFLLTGVGARLVFGSDRHSEQR